MSELDLETHFEVDISQIDADLTVLDSISSNVFRRIARRIRIACITILDDIFETATAGLDKGQMHPIVVEALLRNVSTMPIIVHSDQDGVSAEVDFETLGGWDDIEEASHYHASTEEGQIELPYGGEEMENDVTDRHSFVLAMIEGVGWPNPRGGLIPTAGLWDETNEARQAYWGSKSPAWLYLEYGQEEWEPTIPPHDITGKFSERFNEEATAIFEEEWTAAVELLEEYESAGFERDIGGGAAGRYRDEGGRFLPKP